MLARRLSLVLALVASLACTAKQDDAKQDKKPEPAKAQEPDSTPPEPATPATSPSGSTVALIPGQSIGPVSLGMAKADVEALGYEVHPQYSGMTIPISAYYDLDGKASTVEISLVHSDKDVAVGDLTIPRNASVEQIRELLGDCQDAEVNTGGTIHTCRDGGMSIAIGSGSPDEIWLRITSK